MRNDAPKSADAGSTSRWSAPTISRTMCGTMMPTNKRPARRATPRRPCRERRAHERDRVSAAHDVDAAQPPLRSPRLMRIEHARQRANAGAGGAERHERRQNRRVAADVRRSHQPLHRAQERLGVTSPRSAE